MKKVEALRNLLQILGDADITISDERIMKDSKLDGIVIVLVDSMKSRKAILEAARYRANIPLVIEARSGGDVAAIYAFDPRNPDSLRRYEDTLHDDEEAVPAPCADSQTVDIIFVIASLIGRFMALHAKGKLNGFIEALINFENHNLPVITVDGKIADVRKLFEK